MMRAASLLQRQPFSPNTIIHKHDSRACGYFQRVQSVRDEMRAILPFADFNIL